MNLRFCLFYLFISALALTHHLSRLPRRVWRGVVNCLSRRLAFVLPPWP